MILPLALAQFVASYAATNMNVAISAIASDLGTTVIGVQTATTLFTLVMASLMIPGSKLTDIWGRKRLFVAGLVVYGAGAVIALAAPALGLLIFGYSVLEGVGSALMIPPIYILVTVAFADVTSRARYFGVISGAGGLGAAAGPHLSPPSPRRSRASATRTMDGDDVGRGEGHCTVRLVYGVLHGLVPPVWRRDGI
jgi:MFS family permease